MRSPDAAAAPAVVLAPSPQPEPLGKTAWRAAARRLRRASTSRGVHAATLATAVAELAKKQDAKVVALFHPMGAEVDTRTLANALIVAGITLVYPRLRADNTTMDMVRCDGPAALVARPRSRLMEPVGAAVDPSEIDLLVAPALAVDGQLRRLGQGGGSYDRFLAMLRADTTIVAAVGASCCLPWGPAAGHDRAAHFVCTEAGLFAPISATSAPVSASDLTAGSLS